MELAAQNYQNLLEKVQKIIIDGQNQIALNISYEKVKMAWNVGKVVDDYLEENGELSYGQGVFDDLEKDAAISKRNLYQMLNFYKNYPRIPEINNALGWSHYRNLLTIKDSGRRKYFEILALEEKMSSRDLQEKIVTSNQVQKEKTKELKQLKNPKKRVKLKFSRGELFIYKIAKIGDFEQKFLDLGFNVLANASGNLEDDWKIVKSLKNDYQFSLQEAEISRSKMYVYKAYLEKIIDGDTIKVAFDLGFNIFHKEIIRLAKINTPEIDTASGKRAKSKLKELISHLPYLIIKTNKVDIYGRYIGDIFLPDENHEDEQETADEGKYLNQILIDEGVAKAI